MLKRMAMILILVMAPGTVLAEDNGDRGRTMDWRGAAIEALRDLGQALDKLEGAVGRIPEYGAPFLDDRGNIVIPRRAPRPSGGPSTDPSTVEI